MTIQVDCCEFAATVNLHGILRVLRKQDEAITVWADAICINQADLQERMNHVGIMGTIYKEAAQVHVWFGELPTNWQEERLSNDKSCRRFVNNFDLFYRFPIEELHHQKHGEEANLASHNGQGFKLRAGDPLQSAIEIITLVAGGEDIWQLPFYDIETQEDSPAHPSKKRASKPEFPHEDDVEEPRVHIRAKSNRAWYPVLSALLWLV